MTTKQSLGLEKVYVCFHCKQRLFNDRQLKGENTVYKRRCDKCKREAMTTIPTDYLHTFDRRKKKSDLEIKLLTLKGIYEE